MRKARFTSNPFRLLSLMVSLIGSPGVFANEVRIPRAGQWTEGPTMQLNGKSGAWDARMHNGVYALSGIVPFNGKHHLFYIGANGPRVSDHGPAHRALGLAAKDVSSTSFNHYTKISASKPIVTHIPTPSGCNAEEEGVWRARSLLTADGELVVYYSGLKQTSCTRVRGDIFVATSSDGKTFKKSTSPVLSATGPQWGGKSSKNDEVLPVGAYEQDGTWHLFYISKNVTPEYSLGVISGSSESSFNASTSKKVLSPTETLGGTGQKISEGSLVALSDAKYALFLSIERSAKHSIEVRTFDPANPAVLSPPLATYALDADANSLVYLDRDNGKWLLYYKKDSEDTIRLKTAPVEYSTAPRAAVGGAGVQRSHDGALSLGCELPGRRDVQNSTSRAG